MLLFLYKQCKRCLKKYQIKKDSVEFEITENIFISDVEKTSVLLQKIQKMGIKIALDDFGTGYSSLRYLATMPINTLKFDKSLIEKLGKTVDFNSDLLQSIQPITNKAGILTIAEGIETNKQLEAIKKIGCTCIQGYLWGKPMQKEKCPELF